MSKKIVIIIICILIGFTTMLVSQEDNVKIIRKFKFQRSYVFREKSLQVSKTDMYNSFFIGYLQSNIQILESANPDYIRTIYSDYAKLYINKGSKDNISVGDEFLIIQKGKIVKHPFTHRILGHLYLKKHICTVTCVFETKAIVQLGQVGNAVEVGDYLIPFKSEKPIFDKMPNYKRCKLPDTKFYGDVIHIDGSVDAYGNPTERTIAAKGNYVSVDLGKEFLEKGDYMLFYYKVKRNLPPMIIGLGIVISAHNLTSTVKILDAESEIYIRNPEELNTKVVLLDIPKEEAPKPIPTADEGLKEPVVDELIDEGDHYEADVFFSIDGIEPKSDLTGVMENIKTLLKDKNEYIIILRGYACTIGRVEYNLELSKKRVEFIKKLIMTDIGVSEELIETYFYGEEDCKFDNSKEEERRKNRRVSIEARAR